LNPYGCIFMGVHLGLVAIAQGRLTEASNLLNTAEELVLDHFSGNIAILSMVRTVMAQVVYARNNIAQAAELLSDSLATISTSEGWPELFASGYATSALLLLAKGDGAGAEGGLVSAVELLGSRELPQLNLFLMACRANILVRLDQVAEASASLDEVERGLATNRTVNWAERDEYAIARARLDIVEGRRDQALKALDGVVAEARRQGRIRSELRAETLRVLALAAQGNDEAAAQVLLGVVERTRGERERRMYIDEGPAMAERLRDLVRRPCAPHLSPATLEYVADLLTGFAELAPGDARSRLLADLTPRELEILRELVGGGSNKVIARAIDLNENAVKFHLKNIFRKLGVAGRGMAVTMAEKLDLVR